MFKKIAKLGGILCAIALVTALLLAVTNELTAGTIALRQQETKNAAMIEVLAAEKYNRLKSEQDDYEIYAAFNGYDLVCYTVSLSEAGYGGNINMMIGVTKDGKVSGISIIEMSETPGLGDNAKNPEFTSLVDAIATAIIGSDVKTVEEAMRLEVEGTTIENLIVDKTATIGEKLSFRRFELVEKLDNQVFGTYSHMGGKIVALTVLEGDSEEVAKDVAMQIAAMRPLYLDRESVPADRVETERTILTE